MLRKMPHGVSSMSVHLSALAIKLWLVTPLVTQRPAASHKLAAGLLS